MQIYFMKKDKLPIPVTTLVLMIVTITYKAVLVVIGIVIWIFGRGFLEGYLGQYTGVLPGCRSEYFLRYFHDDPCICTWTGEMDHGKRTETY